LFSFSLLALAVLGRTLTVVNLDPRHRVGDRIDELNGVAVFHNGGVAHTAGRNLATDGYNLGLKYQCVEFVKRYYYQHLDHRMPETYGHARAFFDSSLGDGEWNAQRALTQYRNGGRTKPAPDDILVLGPSILNRYGHVAIISDVTGTDIEIVQQNPGPLGRSRRRIGLVATTSGWRVQDKRALGWLRRRAATAPDHAAENPRDPPGG